MNVRESLWHDLCNQTKTPSKRGKERREMNNKVWIAIIAGMIVLIIPGSRNFLLGQLPQVKEAASKVAELEEKEAQNEALKAQVASLEDLVESSRAQIKTAEAEKAEMRTNLVQEIRGDYGTITRVRGETMTKWVDAIEEGGKPGLMIPLGKSPVTGTWGILPGEVSGKKGKMNPPTAISRFKLMQESGKEYRWVVIDDPEIIGPRLGISVRNLPGRIYAAEEVPPLSPPAPADPAVPAAGPATPPPSS